jgi:hypothetical protein
LDGGTGRGLAWPLGDEPDADQRVDAQAQARVSSFERQAEKTEVSFRPLYLGLDASPRSWLGPSFREIALRRTSPLRATWKLGHEAAVHS